MLCPVTEVCVRGMPLRSVFFLSGVNPTLFLFQVIKHLTPRLRTLTPPPPLLLLHAPLCVVLLFTHNSLGLDAYLSGVYGSLIVAPRQGASVSLAINGDALPGTLVEVATRVSQLRMHVSSFPFLNAMNAVAGGRGGSEPPYALRVRPREAVYVLTRGDRVLVVYHLDVAEPTDRAIARVVAQELTEAYRTVNSAPPVSWSEREPPGELKGFPDLPPPSENSIGYLTFTIFPAPYKSEAQRLGVASQLSLFRSFLQYHLKAAKTYLHARMRSRAEGLQKVLNRAIPEDPFASTDKKLASGKTFVQSAATKQ